MSPRGGGNLDGPINANNRTVKVGKKRAGKAAEELQLLQGELSTGAAQLALPLEETTSLRQSLDEAVLSDMSAAFDVATAGADKAELAAFPDSGLLMAQAGTAAAPASAAPAAAVPAAAAPAAAASTAAVATGSTLATATLSTGIIVAGAVGAAAALGGGGGGGGSSEPKPDTEVPTIVGIVKSVSDKTITLTYSEDLDATNTNTPTAAAFTVQSGGVTLTVASVEVLGRTVVLHLASLPEGAVSVSYKDPTTGNDKAAIQDAAGNDAADYEYAALADGYIRGGKVYIDLNKNGVVDGADQLVATSDADGNFVIPGNAPKGAIIAVGGVNIDTGVPNTAALKAPAGSTVVNPLTTLVQTFVEQQVKASPATVVNAKLISDASAKVAAALGLTNLPTGASLTSYDPIASGNTQVQKAAAQVATIVAMASEGNAETAAKVMSSLTTAIAAQASTTGAATINLADNTVLASVLPNSLTDAAKATISAASTSISNASDIGLISSAQSAALDKIAPAAPTGLTLVTPTKDATPTIRVLLEIKADNGTAAVVSDKVQVFDGGAAIGNPANISAVDIRLGYVEIELPTLAEGSHALTASLTDRAGNTGARLADAKDLVVDLTAPGAPTLNVVATDGVVNLAEKSAGVTLSGTAEAGASVAVTWGTGAAKKAVATVDGVWSLNYAASEMPADAANINLSVVASDTAGNASTALTRVVGIDTTAPAAPAVSDVLGNNVLNASEKAAGVTVAGTAEADASVRVVWGSTTKTVTATGGNWSANFAGSEMPADGSNPISAVATDAAGNAGVAGLRPVLIDSVSPALAVINTVAGNNIVNASEKASGVAVSGTAEAGSSVEVTWGTATKTVTATGGNWTATFAAAEVPADSASSSITAVVKDAAENLSATASRSVSIVTVAPAGTAAITGAEDNVPATQAAVNVASGDGTNDNTPKLSGSLSSPLAAGDVLAVYDGGTRLGEATVADTGWTFQTSSLSNGAHAFKVVVEDAAGNQGTLSAAYNVTIDASVPAATLTVSSLNDDVEAKTGAILTGGATNDAQPTLTGTIQGTMASGDVIRVFDGATLLGNAVVSGTSWSFTPASALAAGAHSLTAAVENAGGNQSVATSAIAFTIDATAPATPVISSFGEDTAPVGDGITRDKSITFSVAAEAGSSVEIFRNLSSGAVSLGKAIETSAAGVFSLTTADLADGAYVFSAKATDAAGNVTSSAATSSLTIDSVAPAKPLFDGVEDDGTSITLYLIAEARSAVKVTYNNIDYTATESSDPGYYALTAPKVGTGYNYTFTTQATDAAGNASAASTQAVVAASGSFLKTETPGSLDLKLISSTSTGLTLAVYPKGTLTSYSSASFEMSLEKQKVSYVDDATITKLWGGLSDAAESVPGELSFQLSDLSLLATNATLLATFNLAWKNGPAFLTLPISDVSLGDNTNLVDPEFSYSPGTGPVSGANGVVDLFLVDGAGAVSATGGTGADTFKFFAGDVELTVTDFVSGSDKIDISTLFTDSDYTSQVSAATAPSNGVAFLKSAATLADVTAARANSSTLDNTFGAVFEALSSGTNKGVVHFFGDADSAAGKVEMVQFDVYLGANSSGGFAATDLITNAVL